MEPLGAPAERPIAAHPLVGREREVDLMRTLWTRTLEERRPRLHRDGLLPEGLSLDRGPEGVECAQHIPSIYWRYDAEGIP